MAAEDPRIGRTREHVLACALEILVADGAQTVTFSEVARRARVSRNTLYRHWPTAEQLLVDVTLRYYAEQMDHPGPSPTVATYLHRLRASLASAEAMDVLTSLASRAERDPTSAEVLRQVAEGRRQVLSSAAGPLTDVQMAQIVGPLFYQAVIARKPLDDAFLAGLLENLRVLGLAKD